jgi:hypothetical protein
MTIKDDTLSDLESLLLTTPAITVLNQVEVELGLAGLSTSSNVQDSENAQRPLKRRRNSYDIEFVEVRL